MERYVNVSETPYSHWVPSRSQSCPRSKIILPLSRDCRSGPIPADSRRAQTDQRPRRLYPCDGVSRSGCAALKLGEKRMDTLRARLHSLGAGRYSVVFDGKLLIERSRDPECDAARALLKRGYTGKLHMVDGKTGKPRTTINIEKAAKLTTEEGPNGPLFRRFQRHGAGSYIPGS